MTAESLYMAGALTVAGIGGITDVTTRRIPNKLTYLGILVAIARAVCATGLAWSGERACWRAGGRRRVPDLLSGSRHGCRRCQTDHCGRLFCRPGRALEIVLASAIAGGIFAICYALWQRRLRTVLVNVVDLVRFHAAAGTEVIRA